MKLRNPFRKPPPRPLIRSKAVCKLCDGEVYFRAYITHNGRAVHKGKNNRANEPNICPNCVMRQVPYTIKYVAIPTNQTGNSSGKNNRRNRTRGRRT